MSKVASYLKRFAKIIPEPIGRYAALVPYSWRLGSDYDRLQREIDKFDEYSEDKKRKYIFNRVERIVNYAYQKVPFYRSHYDNSGFHPNEIDSFYDIEDIPIVTKEDLREWSLEQRSAADRDRLEMNTGGTSGRPLNFYLDSNAFAREWAHMHRIWNQVGYDRTDTKLTIRGHNIGDKAYVYNAVHNEYIMNTYMKTEYVIKDIKNLVKNKNINYIHGYPSSIYELARYCHSDETRVIHEINDSLEGVLLASEYPARVYRGTIEKVFDAPTISWYGHSEMSVLASEWGEKYRYLPMQTYGFCELVNNGQEEYRIIGTSYYNTASPFIRYDTGDLVSNVRWKADIVKSFEIASGRVGNFIVDKSGHRVSLTALIFGRHHDIFGEAEFIQVKQGEHGKATILVTPTGEMKSANDIDWKSLFDDTNVEIDFEFSLIDGPIRSPRGKVKLLVENDVE